jgi:esterase/lipase superfamily enzyme
MKREHHVLQSLAVGDTNLVVYGPWGRPVVVFPSDMGKAWDFEDRGMIGAVADLVEDGRVKLYCLDSHDAASWRNGNLSLEDRAKANQQYEDYLLNDVVPFVYHDQGGTPDIMLTGCSFGAFHAANFCLRRADLFPAALCLSGVYDMSNIGWGERGDAYYFNNPMDYVANLAGDHLGWLSAQASLLLVCGQGQWEDTTGALESTKRFGSLLAEKGIRHEVDLWGHDVPHDWPSWRRQIAHHLPRFV